METSMTRIKALHLVKTSIGALWAYRQMRDMLQHFLVEVAREHFRKSSDLAEEFWQIKGELNRQEDLLRKRAKRARVRKTEFAAKLGSFFQRLEKGAPASDANMIEEVVAGHQRYHLSGVVQCALQFCL